MTLKIKLLLDGIEIVDFGILPDNVKDAIVKILDYGTYIIYDNIIYAYWADEILDIICKLNVHFDLFIMKGE